MCLSFPMLASGFCRCSAKQSKPSLLTFDFIYLNRPQAINVINCYPFSTDTISKSTQIPLGATTLQNKPTHLNAALASLTEALMGQVLRIKLTPFLFYSFIQSISLHLPHWPNQANEARTSFNPSCSLKWRLIGRVGKLLTREGWERNN